ncbi:hypothetical protein C2S51_006658 [Perilla frutescens var. frutescens]|nr:hypothetical protein C2S51_006658 [Perilla frutescens var. frutescens]
MHQPPAKLADPIALTSVEMYGFHIHSESGQIAFLDTSFNITCNTSTTPPKPYLKIEDESIEVVEIRVDNPPQIRIKYPHLLAATCYHRGGRVASWERKAIDLRTTQYTFSEENWITAIGCDEFVAAIKNTTNQSFRDACQGTCSDDTGYLISGSCPNNGDRNSVGDGCCRTPLLKWWCGWTGGSSGLRVAPKHGRVLLMYVEIIVIVLILAEILGDISATAPKDMLAILTSTKGAKVVLFITSPRPPHPLPPPHVSTLQQHLHRRSDAISDIPSSHQSSTSASGLQRATKCKQNQRGKIFSVDGEGLTAAARRDSAQVAAPREHVSRGFALGYVQELLIRSMHVGVARESLRFRLRGQKFLIPLFRKNSVPLTIAECDKDFAELTVNHPPSLQPILLLRPHLLPLE